MNWHKSDKIDKIDKFRISVCLETLIKPCIFCIIDFILIYFMTENHENQWENKQNQQISLPKSAPEADFKRNS